MSGDRLCGELDERRCRRVMLEATAQSAHAGRAVAIDHKMTEFARAEIMTAVQLAVDDDRAADTRAECHHQRIATVGASARRHFRKHRAVRVVFQLDGKRQRRADTLGERFVLKREISRAKHRAARRMNSSCTADADGAGVMGFTKRRCRADNIRDQSVGGVARRNGDRFDHAVVVVDDAEFDTRAADINTENGQAISSFRERSTSGIIPLLW